MTPGGRIRDAARMAGFLDVDAVERPAAGWWIAVGSGLGLLAWMALVPSAYAWWATHVTGAISQPQLLALLILAIVTHAAEALVARRIALDGGLEQSAHAWAWQTLLLGFPSLRLLRRRLAR